MSSGNAGSNNRQRTVRVLNVTNGQVLGHDVTRADTSALRRTGLLRHSTLPEGQGLWIVPSQAIHTFGMKFAIDVAFLNRKQQVLKIRTHMDRRGIAVCLRAHSVLELPAGTLGRTGTQPGHQLTFEP